MSYYALHDIKRDRKPYGSNSFYIRPGWAPEVYNTPWLNLQKTGVIAASAGVVVETLRHVQSRFYALNYVYEYPKDSKQWSIYLREIPRTHNFYKSLFKKITYGCVQHSLDAGLKIAIFYYLFGGTWSPYRFCDQNTFKMMGCGFLTGFLTGWTNYPLAVARKAYFADQSWPKELQKGYRSPLHALLKIPFTEGPLYLFRGGLLHYLGNSLGLGWMLFSYVWVKDKCFWFWKIQDMNYNFCKFWILNFSFAVSIIASQPFFTLKEIMDKLPKERGGQRTFNTSWEAFRFLKMEWHNNTTSIISSYSEWFKRHGLILYLTIWYADSLGLMDNFKAELNTLENATCDFLSD
jgi:solute carrier family 25 oxoglutarate transporter 11